MGCCSQEPRELRPHDRDRSVQRRRKPLTLKHTSRTGPTQGGLTLNFGDTVGRYHLHRKLGENGQGKVFLAQDEHGVQYALKIPHVGSVDRFKRELDAAREVESAFVARVWDYDLSHDPPYIAYQVVPGDPLNVTLTKRDLTPPDLAVIFRNVALGLADIHAVSTPAIPQLSHGDLTLDNIMVTERNAAMIIDFGAAKMGTDTDLSRELFGKFGYFAPEQLRGVVSGPPADIWQLGVTLAAAATGHMPFGNGPGSHQRILDDMPNLNGLPAILVDAVLACLRMDPSVRPTATAVAFMLRPSADRWNFQDSPDDILSPVIAVGFTTEADGILQRRANTQFSADKFGADNRRNWLDATSDIAVGDLVQPGYRGDLTEPGGNVIGHVRLRPHHRTLIRAPQHCPGCGTVLLATAGNWRRAAWDWRWLRDGVESWYCPAGYNCQDQALLNLFRFDHRAGTRLEDFLLDPAAASLRPVDILDGTASTTLALLQHRQYGHQMTEQGLQRHQRRRTAFIDGVRQHANLLPWALGAPGTASSWGLGLTLQDLRTDTPGDAMPAAVREQLRQERAESLCGWWEEHVDELQACVRAVLSGWTDPDR